MRHDMMLSFLHENGHSEMAAPNRHQSITILYQDFSSPLRLCNSAWCYFLNSGLRASQGSISNFDSP
jgi:hypothetical protein